jgi:hypothetical protein
VKILVRQLHEETLTSLPAPPIAINAADQTFAIMVDFDGLTAAFFAGADLTIVQAHDTHSPC